MVSDRNRHPVNTNQAPSVYSSPRRSPPPSLSSSFHHLPFPSTGAYIRGKFSYSSRVSLQNSPLPHPSSFTDSFFYYRKFLHATHLDPTARTADLPQESPVCIPGHVTVPKLSSTVCQDGNTQPGCCRCLARPVCFGLVGWSLLRERAYFAGLVITSFPSFPSLPPF